MKNLILVLFTITLGFAQQPETADSIYWSAKYCNSAETIEDCTNSWIWNGSAEDCIQPSELFCEALFPEMCIYFQRKKKKLDMYKRYISAVVSY